MPWPRGLSTFMKNKDNFKIICYFLRPDQATFIKSNTYANPLERLKLFGIIIIILLKAGYPDEKLCSKGIKSGKRNSYVSAIYACWLNSYTI